MKRYLVTGATGFLGSHVVSALRRAEADVVALCRQPLSLAENRSPIWADEEVEVAVGDVLDQASVERAAKGCHGVFHCAGKVSREPGDAEALYRLHVEGTQNVLRAAITTGAKRAVIASTSGVVAVSREPFEIDEEGEDPMDIIGGWPYYRSKLFAERAAFEMSCEELEVIAVNPTLLLGPGDVYGSSTEDVRRFLEGKMVAMPRGGLSFVDARDAAEAMLAAMDRGRDGARYLLAAKNMTIEDFIMHLSRLSGVSPPRVRAPKSVALSRWGAKVLGKAAERVGLEAPMDEMSAEMAQYFWYVDSRLAAEELGFVPRDPSETLLETIEDLQARGVVWPAV